MPEGGRGKGRGPFTPGDQPREASFLGLRSDFGNISNTHWMEKIEQAEV